MSWSFKPGDRVVCVDARRPSPELGGRWHLREGQTYEIIGVQEQDGCLPGGGKGIRLCLVLMGVPGKTFGEDNWGRGYAASRFRPVRTTSIEALRAHLNTIPANRSVDA